MKAIIFDEAMILDLMTTGTAVKLSKVSPQPDAGLIWGGWILDSTGNEKDIGKGLWLDQYPLSTKEVRIRCPHGRVGDVRWVKETWAVDVKYDNQKPSDILSGSDLYFQADGHSWENVWGHKWGVRGNWRPSPHMPRWASRYTVQCTAVSVEQIEGVWHWRNEYALVKEA